MPAAAYELPYEGAKKMLLADEGCRRYTVMTNVIAHHDIFHLYFF